MKQWMKELSSIVRNRKVLIPVLAVLFVPVLYSAMFLGAFWDPYGKMDQLPVAVVNEDLGAELSGQPLQIGEDLMKKLANSNSFDWEFVSRKQAMKGLEENKYYMAIEIPKDFSEATTSLLSEKPTQARLGFITNDSLNFLSAQIGNTAVERIRSELNKEVTKAYTTTVFEQLGSLAEGLTQASSGTAQLNDGALKVKDGVQQLSQNLERLTSGTAQLLGGENQLLAGSEKLKQGSARIANGAQELSQGLQQLQAAANDQLAGSAKQAADGAAQLQGGLGQASKSAAQLSDGAQQLAAGLAQLAAANSTLAADAGFQQLVAASKQVAGGAEQLAAAEAQLAAASTKLAAGNGKLAEGAAALSGKLTAAAQGSTALAQGAQDLKHGTSELESGLKQAAGGTAKLANGMSQLTTGSGQLLDGVSQMAEGTEQLHSKLSGAASKTSSLSASDEMIEMFANPVGLDWKKQHDVPNYGTGFSPYFISLGLFVGALLLTIVFNLREPAGTPSNGIHWFGSKLGVLLTVGVLQALIVDAVVMMGLGLEVESMPAFILFSIVTSVTFMCLIQFLVTVLDHVGRFIAIILLILQLTTSAGTFPVELIPDWMQRISHLLPMTYTVAGFKAAISSGDISYLTSNTWTLVGFAAAFALMTLIYFVLSHKRIQGNTASTPMAQTAPVIQ